MTILLNLPSSVKYQYLATIIGIYTWVHILLLLNIIPYNNIVYMISEFNKFTLWICFRMDQFQLINFAISPWVPTGSRSNESRWTFLGHIIICNIRSFGNNNILHYCWCFWSKISLAVDGHSIPSIHILQYFNFRRWLTSDIFAQKWLR